MSFIVIGNLLINMMCVVKVQYSPAGDRAEALLCIVMLAGDPLVFDGPEADAIWPKLRKMGTPLEAV